MPTCSVEKTNPFFSSHPAIDAGMKKWKGEENGAEKFQGRACTYLSNLWKTSGPGSCVEYRQTMLAELNSKPRMGRRTWQNSASQVADISISHILVV